MGNFEARLAREGALDDLPVIVNPADLKPGTRYEYGPSILGQSGTFVRYEVVSTLNGAGAPVAIFRDAQPAILDWTPDTEVVVGLTGLIRTSIKEA